MAAYKIPTAEHVNEALRLIPTAPLRRAFFEGLKNPHWVLPLAQAGMFSNPPEPERMSDGLVRDHYWPEIDFLVRVAEAAPKAVVDVLLTLQDSNNAWIRRSVFTIGASIPAIEAVRLKPVIKAWSASDFGWRSDPRDIVGFVVNLLHGGQTKMGKWMANLLFRPQASEDPHKPNLALEDYWYEEGLPRVVEALSDEGLKTVLPWLEEYEIRSNHLTDNFDMTDFARESIRDKGARHPSVEQSLIDAVRDLAVKATAKDPRTAKTVLTRRPMLLTRKITLFAATEALREGGFQHSDLLSVATELLADDNFRNDACRIEFGELAREVAILSPSALDSLVDFITAGPQRDMDQLRERLRRDDEESDEELENRVGEIVDTWKHRWLSAVGAKALPHALKSLLAELDSRRGVIDAPLAALNKVTSWVGPSSPISQVEMSAMSPTELVSHLESWHDTGDGWGPEPSHEGQGRELSGLLTTNPRALDGVKGLADKLRPTYLRAILQGWKTAVQADLELNWDHATELIRQVLRHSDISPFPVEGGNWDDDVDFQGAKRAAVNLLEELVKQRAKPAISTETVGVFANLLLRESDDEAAWTRYDSEDTAGGTDPLTLSLNRQWPTRIRGLLNLMSHGKQAPWYEEARSAIERDIERPDIPGASRAVIGERLGRLLVVDPEWLRERTAQLFGSAEGVSREQQIALTTAMATHHYHITLYELLAPAILAATRSSEPLVAGWGGGSEPIQRIGEWVISAIIFGHKTLADPAAEAFFASTKPRVRGAAIGRIAWSMMNSSSVDDAILDRFADLWDRRVEHVRNHEEDKQELSEFFWFVKSGKFDSSWWLPRLKEAVELSPEVAAERFMIGKEIASSADSDPRGALEATKLLLTNRDGAAMSVWDLTHHAVPMVLARAISSDDRQLKQEAVQFMNELGENGNSGLEKEVQDVLSGKVTQDDVAE
ncbi:hypothetical protein OVA06_01715 [Pseudarthrobacter sp. SL88]|uniref:hypothetical protein n=1 Tax=Pseudarthrobacter sp. SL88 TaxID=2994666 RepID=UPI0022736631|nr:hypothetical protein [Pseudarthrobacter sp. SL88]MCY1673441.1 hypothetical protein [Pseudarthrobacter sp. SL88]